MDQVSALCRRRHLSRRTEEAYRFWIRRYILFHGKQHPRTLGTQAIAPFVNHLAVDRKVAASTQSQALNALLFLYRDVLGVEVGHLDGLRRVQRLSRIPVVLTTEEVRDSLANMHGTPRLIAEVLYGAGLRVTECMTLRIKDLDFRAGTITVRSGKGAKDRTTLLPECLREALQRHMLNVVAMYKEDLSRGRGYAPLPGALHRKYPKAARSIGWQFVFPSKVVRPVPRDGASASLARLRIDRPEGVQAGVGTSRHPQACQRTHAAPFVRHPSIGRWHRYPNDSAASWTPQLADDDDLHARPPDCSAYEESA